MTQLFRQNPFLRIGLFFGIGVYLLDEPVFFVAQLIICVVSFALSRIFTTKIFLSACLASMCMLMGAAQQFLLKPEDHKPFIPENPSIPFTIQPVDTKHNEMFQQFTAHHDSSEAGLMVALLVGDTQYIESATKRQYKSLGLSHLLAVSGMHIGLIFQAVILLLQTTTRNRFPKWTVVIGLGLIWGFTHIGQYSPSLLRASIMFTCMQLGKAWNEKCGALNALGISFVLILVILPKQQFHWGFILSHLAVLGIVLHHRKWQKITIECKRCWRWLIQSLVTTWNAQLYTSIFLLPITLLFPTYFMISNFLLVPLFSILLFSCFGEWVLAQWIPQLPVHCLNDFLFDALAFIIQHLQSLPYLQCQICGPWWIVMLIIMGVAVIYYFIIEWQWRRAAKATLGMANMACTISIVLVIFSKPEIHLWRDRKEKKRLWSFRGEGDFSAQMKNPSIFLVQKGVRLDQSP